MGYEYNYNRSKDGWTVRHFLKRMIGQTDIMSVKVPEHSETNEYRWNGMKRWLVTRHSRNDWIEQDSA